MALGIADVDALLDSIDEDQFAEWMEYYRLEPWDLANRNAPVVACILANAFRGEKSSGFEVVDFLPPEVKTEEMERERAMTRKIEEMKCRTK